MRFNEKELIAIAQKDGDLTGRLQYTQFKGPPGSYKASGNGFRDRFFKLVGNLLFYFRFNEVGAIDFKEPVGVIVLENYSVQPEYDVDLSFAFGILFLDEPDKRHIFTARTDKDVQLWINTLQTASYQHWSLQLKLKKNRLSALLQSRQFGIPASDAERKEITVATSNTTKGATNISSYLELATPLLSLDFNNQRRTNYVEPKPSQLQPILPPPPLPPRPSAKTSATRSQKTEEDLIRF